MYGYSWGARSSQKLSTCHEDLQKVFNLAIKRSSVDVSIVEGHRPVERQKELYAIGRTVETHRKPVTKIDGVTKLGKHNEIPSKAIDFMIWSNNQEIRKRIAWDEGHLAYFWGVLDSCAKELYEAGEITHLLRWGGDWDRDGVLYIDQDFDDAPHVELYKPKN